jgi:hypothetical protein
MAASNTSSLNLGGSDGMFDIPPEPKKAEQTQRTANSTENASNAGGRADVNGNPRKPPGQEHSGIVYRYPRSRFQPGQDMIKIDIFNYDRSATENNTFSLGTILRNTIGEVRTENIKDANGNITGTRDVQSIDLTKLNIPSATQSFLENKSKLRKNQRTIYLPIPQKISDSLRVDYSEDRLSPVAAAAVATATSLLSADGGSVAKVRDFVGKVTSGQYKFEGIDGAGMNSLKTGLAASAIRSLNMNVSAQGLISRASGQVLQSNLELLFSGMTLRTFPFIFEFAPRDEKEAEEVMLIIRIIKMAMTPSGRDSVLMTAPDLFQFTYISGKERHPFLNSFKVGVLTNMTVDYTAGGNYATYGGKYKSPVHMRMQLDFKEINPVFREDYEQMGSTPGMGGVGF